MAVIFTGAGGVTTTGTEVVAISGVGITVGLPVAVLGPSRGGGCSTGTEKVAEAVAVAGPMDTSEDAVVVTGVEAEVVEGSELGCAGVGGTGLGAEG